MEPPRNIVGPRVRYFRDKLGLSQAELAARYQRSGWDVSRDIIARIELQVRIVPDFELENLAMGLGVKVRELFPSGQNWN